jgi:hypothetical protein
MTPTEQAEAELTWKFMQHHTLDDSRDSYVRNGQWAYGLGYRAGIRHAASPKREWVGLTDDEAQQAFKRHNCDISKDLAGILARAIEAKLKEKNT